MRVRGTSSWQIRVDQWAQAYELPLWVRAAERIEAAGALVPGPLEIEPAPAPTPPGVDGEAARQRADQLAEGWTAWWDAVVRRPSPDPVASTLLVDELDGVPFAPPDLSFSPPDFDGLRRWPALHEVVAHRWLEGHRWQNGRKREALGVWTPLRSDNGRVVREVERSLGRPVHPFTLELIILPVADDEVRRVWDSRFLVPRRLYEGPGWPDVLQRMVVRLGG
jgi:hypothetical protein